jgi:hypothetical protein
MRNSPRKQDYLAGAEDALDAMLAQDRKRRARPVMFAARIGHHMTRWARTLARYAGKRPF